jgi:hypothetical protein
MDSILVKSAQVGRIDEQRHMTLPLLEDRADDDEEGACGHASQHISRDHPIRWQLGSRQRRSIFVSCREIRLSA